jgi:hypothetical protein
MRPGAGLPPAVMQKHGSPASRSVLPVAARRRLGRLGGRAARPARPRTASAARSRLTPRRRAYPVKRLVPIARAALVALALAAAVVRFGGCVAGLVGALARRAPARLELPPLVRFQMRQRLATGGGSSNSGRNGAGVEGGLQTVCRGRGTVAVAPARAGAAPECAH